MEQWAILAVVVIAGLMVVSLMQTLISQAARYVLFVGMGAAIWKWEHPDTEGFVFLQDMQIFQNLAIVGALGFIATFIVMTALFRKSRFRILLYPVLGFFLTFAASSVWTYVEAA